MKDTAAELLYESFVAHPVERPAVNAGRERLCGAHDPRMRPESGLCRLDCLVGGLSHGTKVTIFEHKDSNLCPGSRVVVSKTAGILSDVAEAHEPRKKNEGTDLAVGRDDPTGNRRPEGTSTGAPGMFMNLVINASEAIGDEDGAITISTGAVDCSEQYLGESYSHGNSSAGRHISLEVSDTGCGMDAATQARLFEPFYTTKFTGRGLGLSAVLGIVQGHKGALRLTSQPGQGTTFRVLLPASQADMASLAKSASAETALWHGSGTVLLVDDEEAIRFLGTHMLASLGFTVLTAADGREALEVYAQHGNEIALVLVDLTMPNMNGEETFRRLRLLDPNVRVTISSGYDAHDIASRFAGEGLVGFLQKPYTLAQMAEGLRVALDG